MTIEKKKVVLNSFSNCKYNYCPLVWIFPIAGTIPKLIFCMKDVFDPLIINMRIKFVK